MTESVTMGQLIAVEERLQKEIGQQNKKIQQLEQAIVKGSIIIQNKIIFSKEENNQYLAINKNTTYEKEIKIDNKGDSENSNKNDFQANNNMGKTIIQYPNDRKNTEHEQKQHISCFLENKQFTKIKIENQSNIQNTIQSEEQFNARIRKIMKENAIKLQKMEKEDIERRKRLQQSKKKVEEYIKSQNEDSQEEDQETTNDQFDKQFQSFSKKSAERLSKIKQAIQNIKRSSGLRKIEEGKIRNIAITNKQSNKSSSFWGSLWNKVENLFWKSQKKTQVSDQSNKSTIQTGRQFKDNLKKD